MRRLHEAIGAVETYSPAEERFTPVKHGLQNLFMKLVLRARSSGNARTL